MPAIDFKREIKREAMMRDTRTGSQKFLSVLKMYEVRVSMLIGAVLLAFLAPAFADVVAIVALLLCWIGSAFKLHEGLPMCIPQSSGLIDPNERHPKTGEPLKAKGIVFVGNDVSSRQEVWLSDTQLRTHLLFFGTTGSGKAQPDDTPVLTPRGWTLMANLRENDEVCTPGGGIQRVLSIHPQGWRKQYVVTVMDAPDLPLRTSACPEHLWHVKVVQKGQPPDAGEEMTLNSEQILQAMREGKQCLLPVVDIREAVNDESGAPAHLLKGQAQPGQNTQLGAGIARWRPIRHVRTARAQSCRCIRISGQDNLYVVRASDDFWRDENGCMVQKGIVTHNTEFLISLIYNNLIQCSGFIYVDGKGDAKTYRSAYSLLRAMGRDDDALVINFQTGAKDIIGAQSSKMSNTLNICATGSSGMLAQTFMGLMAVDKQDVWSERANSLIEALTKPLVFLRDQYKMPLDVSVVRNYFVLEWLEAMVLCFPYVYPGIELTLSGMKAYLDNLPGWTRDNALVRKWLIETKKEVAKQKFSRSREDGGEGVPFNETDPRHVSALQQLCMKEFDVEEFSKALSNGMMNAKGEVLQGQENDTLLQHGYITMQLVRSFNSLSDTYGYIMKAAQAEVDMTDVFLNRRALMVLLPALEKAPAELSSLGRVIVTTLRATMAIGLGAQIEGETIRIIDSRPTNAPTPFMCVLDEYGYYTVVGFSVVPAQARSLGFAVTFAGQDLPAFEKSSKEEAKTTLGNTNSKFCGKLECVDTYEYFRKLAGEGSFSTMRHLSSEIPGVLGGMQFLDTKTVDIERQARVSQEDLRGHGSGKWHFFFGNVIVHLNSFYANPRPVSMLRTNHFIGVERPSEHQQRAYNKAIERFKTAIGKLSDEAVAKSVSEKLKARDERRSGWEKERPALGLRELIAPYMSDGLSALHNPQDLSALPDLLKAFQLVNLKPLVERYPDIDLYRLAPVSQEVEVMRHEGEDARHAVLKKNARIWRNEIQALNFPDPQVRDMLNRGDGLTQCLCVMTQMMHAYDRRDAMRAPAMDDYFTFPELQPAGDDKGMDSKDTGGFGAGNVSGLPASSGGHGNAPGIHPEHKRQRYLSSIREQQKLARLRGGFPQETVNREWQAQRLVEDCLKPSRQLPDLFPRAPGEDWPQAAQHLHEHMATVAALMNLHLQNQIPARAIAYWERLLEKHVRLLEQCIFEAGPDLWRQLQKTPSGQQAVKWLRNPRIFGAGWMLNIAIPKTPEPQTAKPEQAHIPSKDEAPPSKGDAALNAQAGPGQPEPDSRNPAAHLLDGEANNTPHPDAGVAKHAASQTTANPLQAVRADLDKIKPTAQLESSQAKVLDSAGRSLQDCSIALDNQHLIEIGETALDISQDARRYDPDSPAAALGHVHERHPELSEGTRRQASLATLSALGRKKNRSVADMPVSSDLAPAESSVQEKVDVIASLKQGMDTLIRTF